MVVYVKLFSMLPDIYLPSYFGLILLLLMIETLETKSV